MDYLVEEALVVVDFGGVSVEQQPNSPVSSFGFGLIVSKLITVTLWYRN